MTTNGFFKKILLIYLRQRERAQAMGGGAEGEGETDSLLNRRQDIGLHPRTPR